MHELMWVCKGKPEGRNSVLDSPSVCWVTRASHLAVMGHLRNEDSSIYSASNSKECCEYA